MRIVVAALCIACASAHAALPGGVARAFHEAGIPLSGVSVIVRESGQPQPLFSHDANRAMNPASVMKIITTYAALDLLGPDFRWKTEAYLAGKLDRTGTLAGNLVIKGYGDPKITIEQWQAFMGDLRTLGRARTAPAAGPTRARRPIRRTAECRRRETRARHRPAARRGRWPRR